MRLLDIDTPETDRPRCENELTLGLEAKLRLRQLLDAGQVAYVVDGRYRTDRFNRTLAHVTVAGRDVGAVLLAEGLALVWSPGPKAKAARLAIWCRK
ncbi:MAG: thermonuclease family protein [Mesorhizobium sp.]|nr:MAG: thermonuclease family protein [Mesorhizobium sp.]